MQIRLIFPLLFTIFLTACGNPPPEKAIIGTWVQANPTSTTQAGVQATTSDTVLTFEKDGDVRLRRQLDLRGAGFPETGVGVDVDLSGQWRMEGDALFQTLENSIVTARTSDPASMEIARQLQDQSGTMSESQKRIIALDREQLMLQDLETGVTDVYRRR